jgi:hypothetical protein
MNDTVICETCEKAVPKKYAFYISIMGNEDSKCLTCFDCDEERENNFQNMMEKSEQEMILEYGKLFPPFNKMREIRLKMHAEHKEMMKKLRDNL